MPLSLLLDLSGLGFGGLFNLVWFAECILDGFETRRNLELSVHDDRIKVENKKLDSVIFFPPPTCIELGRDS